MAVERREMIEVLNAAMANAADDLTEDQRLRFGHKLLKTYAIELDSPARTDWLAALASENTVVEPGDDNNLATLTSPQFTAFADRIEDRFVLVHSLETAQSSDRFIDGLLGGTGLDRLWLGNQTLETIAGWGTFRGFGSRFDRKVAAEDAEREDAEEAEVGTEQPPEADAMNHPVQSLRIRLSGSESRQLLNVLKEHRLLRHSVSLSSVRMRYRDEGGQVITDEVFYSGRVTARGNSYELHRGLVGRIVDAYTLRLASIEEEAALSITDEGGLMGSTVVIQLNGETDVDSIVNTVFSGTQPFRLAGIPLKLSDDYVSVRAVDLHSGSPLNFEIAPELVRAYVPAGVCGNTLLRLETNMQQYFDAAVRLELGTTGALI